MARLETVFVLGAGASLAYGYPTGADLARFLAKLHLQADSPLEGRRSEVETFCNELRLSGCDSIDTFLENRDDLRDIGLAWLLERIGELEFTYKENPFSTKEDDLRDHWYKYMFNRLIPDGMKFEHVAALGVTFVTFNYDRSLEHFWHTALQHRFNTSSDAARDAQEAYFPVIHVYGDVGPLPWQTGADDIGRPYGCRWTPSVHARCCERIALITDGSPRSGPIVRARTAIINAKAIFFLGFGYHRTNMKRLQIPFGKSGLFTTGTAFRVSKARRAHLRTKYTSLQLYDSDNEICDFLEDSAAFIQITDPDM